MSYRVGFASTGDYIDQHFGSARYFQIYDIDENEHKLIETRKTVAKCQGNCDGGFEHLLKALSDCDAVFVTKIGQSAAAFMISHGIRVFEAEGELEEIIAQIIEGDLLN